MAEKIHCKDKRGTVPVTDDQSPPQAEDASNAMRPTIRPPEIDRRTFLKGLGVGAGGVILSACTPRLPDDLHLLPRPTPSPFVPAALWEVSPETLNLYRSEFQFTRGDTQGYAFHCVNCRGNCAWTVFEKNGGIVREEQLAMYPQITARIPDANPRGCNKGAAHSASLYQKDRLLYPLKRVGARGDGEWQRVPWDEALNTIAEKIVDTMTRGGPGEIMVHTGTGILSEGKRAGPMRLASLLGSIRLLTASAVGDMFTGAHLAYGVSLVGHSAESWFETDYALIVGMNPSVTRIPDAHYLWEGKYRGARIVAVSPDFNPTARQSSLWVPIKPGTDSFLLMAMVHVVLKERLYDATFIREQTDLPFLVKTKDGRLLRQSDMLAGGSDEIFYLYDESSGRPLEAPGSQGSPVPTLRLALEGGDGAGEIEPALEGTFQVRNARGEEIEVTTVFERLKQEVEKFSPEQTQQYTGIHPSVVYDEARHFARAKTALVMMGFQVHKHFWGILSCWGATLLLALTGHTGPRGGLDVDNEWNSSGLGPLAGPKPSRLTSGAFGEWLDADMTKSFLKHYDDGELKAHLGLNKDELLQVAEEARQQNWKPYFGKPKVTLLFGDNRFVRNSAQEDSARALLDGMELYVNVNYRMDSSAQLADIVLPATASAEGWDIRANPGHSRFANLAMPPAGLTPPGEAKSEWEICMLLTQRIQQIARERGIGKIEDPDFQITRDLDTLYDDFTLVGDQPVTSDQGVVEWILNNEPIFRGWGMSMVRRTGFVPLNELAGQLGPLYPDRPYYPFGPQVHLKRPYPTLSGRQQFYIDHDLYLKLGCATPTARLPVRPSQYPFAYYTPHARHGIHSTYRAVAPLLRLQRGVPHVCINPKTAETKGIEDGDTVRVFNNVGELYAMAKLHPGTPPTVVWLEHAWENFQFKGRKGYNSVVPGILNPLELVGGYGHLSHSVSWDLNQLASEVSLDVEKV